MNFPKKVTIQGITAYYIGTNHNQNQNRWFLPAQFTDGFDASRSVTELWCVNTDKNLAQLKTDIANELFHQNCDAVDAFNACFTDHPFTEKELAEFLSLLYSAHTMQSYAKLMKTDFKTKVDSEFMNIIQTSEDYNIIMDIKMPKLLDRIYTLLASTVNVEVGTKYHLIMTQFDPPNSSVVECEVIRRTAEGLYEVIEKSNRPGTSGIYHVTGDRLFDRREDAIKEFKSQLAERLIREANKINSHQDLLYYIANNESELNPMERKLLVCQKAKRFGWIDEIPEELNVELLVK